ncbi:hypothetical protein GALMADRAFT_1261500 [Galerina marginata CBS 339.88]|uniref:Uncharacterized protein n=1 Tax=Galerina marginata (strain CBS 339.88) TaxID=685588 RepID=A0A067TI60_GALM3|nr:hypothetical protein GALMADRAFT_1261500 [Galerina marginata CBS 339.88]
MLARSVSSSRTTAAQYLATAAHDGLSVQALTITAVVISRPPGPCPRCGTGHLNNPSCLRSVVGAIEGSIGSWSRVQMAGGHIAREWP